MTAISIRQSGGANIVSLPKAIVKTLGLQVGSKLDLSVEDQKIVLTPFKDSPSLESLLAGSPQDCFQVTDEDRAWLDAEPVGQED